MTTAISRTTAAATGGKENVEINLAEIHDEAFKSAIHARLFKLA